MRNWDVFISIQAEKNGKIAQRELASLLQECEAISKKIGECIDLILNRTTRSELRDGTTLHVVRSDESLREWEATFSVVNMAATPIIFLICGGYYLQAICLVRQEFEGIAQFRHILEKSRTTNRAPNIKHIDEKLRRLYSDLSKGAHIASHDAACLQAPPPNGIGSILAVLPHGPSLLPVYSREVGSSILEIHRDLRLTLFEHLREHTNAIDE